MNFHLSDLHCLTRPNQRIIKKPNNIKILDRNSHICFSSYDIIENFEVLWSLTISLHPFVRAGAKIMCRGGGGTKNTDRSSQIPVETRILTVLFILLSRWITKFPDSRRNFPEVLVVVVGRGHSPVGRACCVRSEVFLRLVGWLTAARLSDCLTDWWGF